jgi:hypothetical protein
MNNLRPSLDIDNVIEKTLGKREKMIIMKECIIGFSKSVKIEDPEEGSGCIKKNYVRVEGPGMILIESGPQEYGIIARTFKKREATR